MLINKDITFALLKDLKLSVLEMVINFTTCGLKASQLKQPKRQ